MDDAEALQDAEAEEVEEWLLDSVALDDGLLDTLNDGLLDTLDDELLLAWVAYGQ